MSYDYGLVVRKISLWRVKDVLKSRGLLQESVKIIPYSESTIEYDLVTILVAHDAAVHSEKLQNITNLSVDSALSNILGIQLTPSLKEDIVNVVPIPHKKPRTLQNPLQQAISKALPAACPFLPAVEIDELLAVVPKSYGIYAPMLLLPQHMFAHDRWTSFMKKTQVQSSLNDQFFAVVANEMGVSHIAINAPIPAHNHSSPPNKDLAVMEENLLRSPTNLQPVYGDFGPALSPFPSHIPTSSDFDKAFWVSVRQNGIIQIWAPRYTMFSSGNVTEKARVLKLSSVESVVEEGRRSGKGCSAVDLFAGIGYFAFSYARAGVSKVICWDLNPWSVEGFQRGAAANKWTSRIIDPSRSAAEGEYSGDDISALEQDGISETFLIFSETNKNADQRIASLRSRLPPIRHVNCGMLPSVGYAWNIAVKALDHTLGGWLHLHETVAENEVQERAETFRILVLDYITKLNQAQERAYAVSVDHVEHVKSVGPRLWHIVVDIHISPVESQSNSLERTEHAPKEYENLAQERRDDRNT